MSSQVQVNISLPEMVRDRMDELAIKHGLSRSAAIRRALGIMQAIDEAAEHGRYVGTARDREVLETVIVCPV